MIDRMNDGDTPQPLSQWYVGFHVLGVEVPDEQIKAVNAARGVLGIARDPILWDSGKVFSFVISDVSDITQAVGKAAENLWTTLEETATDGAEVRLVVAQDVLHESKINCTDVYRELETQRAAFFDSEL